ncbi:hypothetical protein WA026_000237 [Henosepilachna vigintioctopunctata]|uniref:Uncharacterized protein n=1 Tax=Henosepilachna vigintioctopunctata TaxID=420089 RepID=A0AAW1UWY4_9CUCU
MEDTTYSLQETIYMYGYDGIVFNNVLNITEKYYMQLGRCYTFQTNESATKLTIDGGIFFYFDFDNINTTHLLPDLKHSAEGLYIFIHDAMEVIADLKYQKKTYSQSISLEAGELLYAALDIKVFHTVDRSNDHCESNENYSQSKCIRNCLHNKIMEEFNCSLPWLKGDKIYPRCNNSEVIDDITSTINNKRTEYISTCNCPVSCHLYFYCQKIVKRKPYDVRKRSLLSLYYDSSIVTVVQEAVSYNWYSLIADLGGSLGLFLGLSVIGFIEIIEACFSFLFKKRRQKLDREEYITSIKDQRIIGTLIRNFASRNCTEEKTVISK